MIAFWQESYDKYVNSVLKSNDIRLPTKDCIVKAVVFPVIMHSCESKRRQSTEELMLLNCGAREDS